MKLLKVSIPLIVLSASLPVFGGVVYNMQVKTLSGPNPGEIEGTISVEGMKLHLKTDPDATIIFDGDQNRMYIINDDEKNYLVFDQATVESMAAKINPAMEEMRKQLEQMPPEQRKMVEKMMDEQMKQLQPPKLEVEKTSETQTLSGYDCTKVEVTRDGQVVRELWITDWSNVEGASETQDAFKNMADFFVKVFESISLPGGLKPQNPFEQLGKLGGFPVLTKDFDEGELMSETLFQNSEKKALGDAHFKPDPSFEQEKIDF